MPGIWGDGQRGGIFGARVDPRLLQAELERRAEAKRQEMQPGLVDQWRGSLANRILSAPSKLFGGLVADPAMDLATLAGDVIHGRQPTMAADPQTGEFHTDPRLADRAMNAAGMLTLGAGAVPAEANSLRMGIKAYHGSPHDFERFDSSKIGSGEGAQAYGHGIYAAESPAVAETYRTAGPAGNMPAPTYEAPSDVLTRHAEEFGKLSVSSPLLVKGFGALDVEGRRSVVPMMRGLLQDPQISKAVVRLLPVDVMDMLGGKQGASEVLRHNPSMLVDLLPANADHAVAGGVQAVDVLAPYVALATAKRPLMGANSTALLEEGLATRSANKGDLHLRSEIPYPSKRGNMYEVDIAADPEHFLDWDKPLSEQSPKVAGALNQVLKPSDRMPAEWIKSSPGAEQRLSEAGIPGVRYLDQGSRVPNNNFTLISPKQGQIDEWTVINRQTGKHELFNDEAAARDYYEKQTSPTRNYVVFSDDLIKILRKYGVPLSALGAAGAAFSDKDGKPPGL